MSIKIMLSNSEYKVYTSKELYMIAPLGVNADFYRIKLEDGEVIHTFTNLEVAKQWLFIPDLHITAPASRTTNTSGKEWEVYTSSTQGINKYLYVLNTPVNGIVAWGGYNPEDVNF